MWVPDPAYPNSVAALQLSPILDICFGSLLAGDHRAFFLCKKEGITPTDSVWLCQCRFEQTMKK